MKLIEEMYFTLFGKRYHRRGCFYLQVKQPDYGINTQFSNTLFDRKLLPCKYCKPKLK